MENSKIEWCDHTANLWWGCVEVHEGCDNCYAKTLAHRWGHNVWGAHATRRPIVSVWNNLIKYQDAAERSNEYHRVFIGSMQDIFEKPYHLHDKNGKILGYRTDVLRDHLFYDVIPNSPNLIFLLLTKRPGLINRYIPESWKQFGAPDNVYFGTSPVNQPTWDMLTEQLKQVNGKRFLSVEPQLDMIKDVDLDGIDWVIQGGESGPRKRPFNLEWARYMRDTCAEQKTPYFFKQIDKIKSIPDDLMVRQFPTDKKSGKIILV